MNSIKKASIFLFITLLCGPLWVHAMEKQDSEESNFNKFQPTWTPLADKITDLTIDEAHALLSRGSRKFRDINQVMEQLLLAGWDIKLLNKTYLKQFAELAGFSSSISKKLIPGRGTVYMVSWLILRGFVPHKIPAYLPAILGMPPFAVNPLLAALLQQNFKKFEKALSDLESDEKIFLASTDQQIELAFLFALSQGLNYGLNTLIKNWGGDLSFNVLEEGLARAALVGNDYGLNQVIPILEKKALDISSLSNAFQKALMWAIAQGRDSSVNLLLHQASKRAIPINYETLQAQAERLMVLGQPRLRLAHGLPLGSGITLTEQQQNAAQQIPTLLSAYQAVELNEDISHLSDAFQIALMQAVAQSSDSIVSTLLDLATQEGIPLDYDALHDQAVQLITLNALRPEHAESHSQQEYRRYQKGRAEHIRMLISAYRELQRRLESATLALAEPIMHPSSEIGNLGKNLE